jgi:hypothetical protein
MFSRYLALASLVIAPTLFAGTNSKSTSFSQVTTWSRSAHPLPYAVNADPALRNARIPSPNGKYEIACNSVAHEQQVSASVSEMMEAPLCEIVAPGKRVPIDLKVGPEALWAPDSDAVAITHSLGGALGTYQVLIYRPRQAGAHDVSTAVRSDLAKKYPACVGAAAGCSAGQRRRMRWDPSWVNVAAIRWMEKSDQLLMMAWVPDSSDFGANLGRRQGYVVDTHNGKIVRKYSEAEFEKRFRKYFGDWGL